MFKAVYLMIPITIQVWQPFIRFIPEQNIYFYVFVLELIEGREGKAWNKE